MKTPYIIKWVITHKCNLTCQGCIYKNNNNKELNYEQVTKIIDDLSNNKVFMISFNGGEPFARKDFFNILRYCNSKNIKSLIATNAQNLDFENILELSKLGVSAIAISIDSFDKNINDKIRGTGTLENALKVIKLIKENTSIGIIIATTIRDFKPLEYERFLKKAFELGADRVKIQPLIIEKNGIDFINLNREELKKIKKISVDYAKEINKKDFVKFPCYVNYLNYNFDVNTNPTCAYEKSLVIQPDGNITLCELLDKNVFYNLLESDFSNLINYNYAVNIDNENYLNICERCSKFNVCKGGCVALNRNSDINSFKCIYS